MKIGLLTLLTLSFLPKSWAIKYNLEDLKVLGQELQYIEFFEHWKDPLPRERKKEWKITLIQTLSEYYKNTPPSYAELYKFPLGTFAAIQQLLNISPPQELTENEQKTFNDLSFGWRERVKKIVSLCHLEDKPEQSCFKAINESLLTAKTLFSQQVYNTFSYDLLSQVLVEQLPTPNFISSLSEKQKTIWLKQLSQKIDLNASNLVEFYCQNSLIMNLILYHQLQEESFVPPTNCQQLISTKLNAHDLPQTPAPWSVTISKNQLFKLHQLGHVTRSKHLYLSLINDFTSNEQWDNQRLQSLYQQLESIKKSPQLREKILKSLKEDPFLPDSFLSDQSQLNTKQQALLLKKIGQSFPELIDFYGHSCLNYLSGDVYFPKGNPTLHCDKFMVIAKKYQLIPQALTQRFENYKNFNF